VTSSSLIDEFEARALSDAGSSSSSASVSGSAGTRYTLRSQAASVKPPRKRIASRAIVQTDSDDAESTPTEEVPVSAASSHRELRTSPGKRQRTVTESPSKKAHKSTGPAVKANVAAPKPLAISALSEVAPALKSALKGSRKSTGTGTPSSAVIQGARNVSKTSPVKNPPPVKTMTDTDFFAALSRLSHDPTGAGELALMMENWCDGKPDRRARVCARLQRSWSSAEQEQ